MPHRLLSIAAFLIAALFATQVAAAPILLDDFEDGTTQNWFAGGGPVGGVPPVPPTNVPTGGPAGLERQLPLGHCDWRRRCREPAGRMNGTQWALDFIAAGITKIEMDVINLGTTELSLRLLFEDPIPGPPLNIAISDDPIVLAPGSGWTHVSFPITPAALIPLLGTEVAALSQATLVRLFHGDGDTFPPQPIVASLGVDNISAVAEPSTVMLLLPAIALMRARGRRRAVK